MRLNITFSILKKELLETLRDKRALFAMIGVPLVIYPLIFIIISEATLMQKTKIEEKDSRIAFGTDCPEGIRDWLSSLDKVKVIEADHPEEELSEGKLDVIVYAPADALEQLDANRTVEIEIRYDQTEVRSTEARSRIRNCLQEKSESYLKERLASAGLAGEFIRPISIKSENIASAKKTTGNYLGMIIPLFLIITIAVGAFYPAVDLTAGEKERGTFETLLSTPTSRMEIVSGKFLTVFGLSIITGLLNMGSMIGVLLFQVSRMKAAVGPEADLPDMVFAISTPGMITLFAMIVPLSFFICSVMMTIALFARSFKEAQNYVTPFYMMIMLPCMIVGMPGIELTQGTALIPVANVALLFKAILMQKLAGDLAFMVFVSTVAYAMLALMCAVWVFKREDVILSQEKGMPISLRRSQLQPRKTLTPDATVMLYAVMLLILYYGGTYFQSRELISGLIITEWGLLLGTTVFGLWYFRVNLKSALHLKTPPPFTTVLVAVASVGTLILGLQYNLWQNQYWPVPPEMAEASQKLFDPQTPSWLLFFAIAVSAAICEEVLFRGAILSGLKNSLHPAAVVIIVAVMFGIFHMSMYRVVPTALLGIWITYVVLRTGSIFVGMVAHLVNNGLVVLSESNLLPKDLTDWLDAANIETNGFPIWLVLVAVLFLVLTIGFIEISKRIQTTQTALSERRG